MSKGAIIEERAGGKRTCHLCTGPIFAGEPCMKFKSGGYGRNQTNLNLCCQCIKDFAEEHWKTIENNQVLRIKED